MSPTPSSALVTYLRSHTPLRVSPEPTPTIYLPLLDAPFPIFLTPSQPHDIPRKVATLSTPSIAHCLSSTPFPYSTKDAEEWDAFQGGRFDATLAQWEEQLKEGTTLLPPQSGTIVGNLRRDDPVTGEWFGDLGIMRWRFEEVEDLEERKRLQEINEGYDSGDERIVWSFGFFLHPDYHGQGIMYLSLKALIETYFVPVLNAKEIRAAAYTGNWASRRTQEKNGFEHVGEFPVPMSESRGGGTKECWLMRWTRSGERAE